MSSYVALCKFPFGDWAQPNIKFMAFAYVSYGWISELQLQQLKIKEHEPQGYTTMLGLVVLVRNVGLVGACFSSQNPHLIYYF